MGGGGGIPDSFWLQCLLGEWIALPKCLSLLLGQAGGSEPPLLASGGKNENKNKK